MENNIRLLPKWIPDEECKALIAWVDSLTIGQLQDLRKSHDEIVSLRTALLSADELLYKERTKNSSLKLLAELYRSKLAKAVTVMTETQTILCAEENDPMDDGEFLDATESALEHLQRGIKEARQLLEGEKP